MILLKIFLSTVLLVLLIHVCQSGKEEEEGVKYANKCEVCKILATELQTRLLETGRSHDVIEVGYSVDDVKAKKKTKYQKSYSVDDVKAKKKTKYQKSELRLIETLEKVCDRILEYNIHKERKDSTRFAKGMSQTFQTLHGLVDKGVKVELGIPFDLWDKPSAEITNMKTQCETLLEENEEEIEEWYFNLQENVPLVQFLCSDRVLAGGDDSCLVEQFKGDSGKSESEKEEL